MWWRPKHFHRKYEKVHCFKIVYRCNYNTENYENSITCAHSPILCYAKISPTSVDASRRYGLFNMFLVFSPWLNYPKMIILKCYLLFHFIMNSNEIFTQHSQVVAAKIDLTDFWNSTFKSRYTPFSTEVNSKICLTFVQSIFSQS